MFGNLNTMLNPQMIVNFLKNNADLKKIGLNFLNSQEAKTFITEDLGYDYDSLKTNMLAALAATKKSDFGEKRQAEMDAKTKLEAYKKLSGQLIKENGFSYISAVIMAGGFVGIDKEAIIKHLNERGYSASKQRIESFYRSNENFFKGIMKSRGVIVDGWNDDITSEDLTPNGVEDKREEPQNLVEIPDIKLEDEAIPSQEQQQGETK